MNSRIEETVTVIKALADVGRVRALLALRGRELCLCQLTAFLELAPSTVSKHMALLRQAGLVETRKTGRWVYYRLAGEDASDAARTVLGWLTRCVGDCAEANADQTQIEALLKRDPEELCRLTCQRPPEE